MAPNKEERIKEIKEWEKWGDKNRNMGKNKIDYIIHVVLELDCDISRNNASISYINKPSISVQY